MNFSLFKLLFVKIRFAKEINIKHNITIAIEKTLSKTEMKRISGQIMGLILIFFTVFIRKK